MNSLNREIPIAFASRQLDSRNPKSDIGLADSLRTFHARFLDLCPWGGAIVNMPAPIPGLTAARFLELPIRGIGTGPSPDHGHLATAAC